MDKLTELIRSGPDPRYSIKALVLQRYEDILRARQLMRTWSDIAAALGLPGRGKDVSGCFLRVEKGIKKGLLKVPSHAPAPYAPAPHAQVQRPVSRVGVPTEQKPVEEKPEFDFEAARIDKNR